MPLNEGYVYREKVAVKDTPEKDNKELYGAEYVWKRNGPDHFCHALLYAMVGLQRHGGEMAKVVGAEDIWGIPPSKLPNVAPELNVPTFIRGESFDF